MTHNLPTRDEMVYALAAYLQAEKDWRDALHAGRYDELAGHSDAATRMYKRLRAVINRLPEHVTS